MLSLSMRVSEGKDGRLRSWLGSILLGLVGFSFAWFRWEVSLFFDVDFLFVSFFVLLAFLFCGRWQGLTAAVIAYTSAFAFSGHPWTSAIFMGEAVFIAALGRPRARNILILVIVYSAAIGAPVIWVLHRLVMGIPAQSTLVLMGKQLLNSVFDALFAVIVFLAAFAYRQDAVRVSFRSLVFTLLLAFALAPVLLLTITSVRGKFHEDREEAVESVEHFSGMTRSDLAEWLREHQMSVGTLANLVGDPAETPREVLQQRVEIIKRLSPEFLRMGIVDARNVTLASSPPAGQSGHSNIGLDLSDTPYPRILRERKVPLVSDIVVERVGRPTPIQVLLCPIVSAGRYRGYCDGIVDPSYLVRLLRSVVGDEPVEITLLDGSDRVVASTRKGLRMMEPFPRPAGGDVLEEGSGVRQWVPDHSAGVSSVPRWWRSYFVEEVAPAGDMPWKIVVEASAVPMLTSLNKVTFEYFVLVALFVVFAVVVSQFASRGLVRPFRLLQRNTEELPLRITAGHADLTWPKSRVFEVEGLVSNFRVMAEALQGSFSELRELNETLEHRVEDRTEEIREREENFRILFDQAADSILLLEVTPGGAPVVRDANAAAFALLGYGRGELIGKPITFLDPDFSDSEKARERGRQLLAGATVRFEAKHRCKDGTVHSLECAVALVRIQGKKMVLSFERDVTDLRLAEKERERLRDELRESQKREAIGTLAGGIAHDFNNILTPLIGHAELALLNLAEDDSAREDLSQLLVSAERASALVQQILAISRREDQGTVAPIALAALVEETIKFLRATIPANVEIRTRLDPGSPPVFGEVGQLQQVLINLCTNARDAMQGNGGVLDISLDPADGPGEGRFVRLSVRDTGTGIPGEILDRIFDPYFTTKPKGKGTGLGLAVTQGIVTALGGRMQAKSAVGEGSTFEVLLPAGKAVEPRPQPESPVALRKEGRHVLVVDDEGAVCDVLGRMLPALGYRVTVCSTAEEALALFRTEPDRFDAVLTDHTMPGMLGLELARELLRIRPDLPVLIGTGFAEGVDEEVARATGLRGFVAKPYGLRKLGEALGRALSDAC